MSTAPYESTGRTGQKQRTRQALVTATRDLVAEGRTPTVEEAAEAAGISRTTAYRYFPNQRALLVAAHPETEAPSLLPPLDSDDPGARLDAVVEAFTDLIAETEPQQRTMLRLSLEDDAGEHTPGLLRQGRAIRWITEALSPLQGTVPDDELQRLVLAVRATTGIEARVWLIDVAGLTGPEATELMRWSARALYRAAVDDQEPSRDG
jgi:AcrR family transcriptional regulator